MRGLLKCTERLSASRGRSNVGLTSAFVYTVSRVFLSASLLVAGLLKASEFATGVDAARDAVTPRYALVALVEFELFAGLWLLFGIYPSITRRFAILGFGALACVSLDKVISGSPSCGCFGRVTVSPWLTLAYDVLAVAALGLEPSGEAGWLSQEAIRLTFRLLADPGTSELVFHDWL